MKKIISVLLSILLFALPLTAYAEDGDALPVMGDATGDSKVTAADARLILRYAAHLENSDGADMMRVDTNGDNTITAADARLTLRVSASLSYFTSGFDMHGAPNALKLINNKTFVTEFEILAFDSSTTITMAMNNGDVFLMYGGGVGELTSSMGDMENMGIMCLDGSTYCLGEINGGKFAIVIPESMQDEFFEDGFSVEEITNTVFSVLPDESLGSPQKITEDEEEFYTYAYEIDSVNYVLYTDSRAVPVKITSDSLIKDEMIFNFISYEGIDDYFDLSGYAVM